LLLLLPYFFFAIEISILRDILEAYDENDLFNPADDPEANAFIFNGYVYGARHILLKNIFLSPTDISFLNTVASRRPIY
jgi:hypothetical protein